MNKKVDLTPSHRIWLAKAMDLAEKSPENGGSPHPSVKVGAIFVGANGRVISKAVNRFARKLDDEKTERYEDNVRSMWVNCAEQMALANAIRLGKKLNGARLYVTLEPCAVCAGLIVESGIKEVIIPSSSRSFYRKLKQKWKKSMDIGYLKLVEAGVKVTFIEMTTPTDPLHQ